MDTARSVTRNARVYVPMLYNFSILCGLSVGLELEDRIELDADKSDCWMHRFRIRAASKSNNKFIMIGD